MTYLQASVDKWMTIPDMGYVIASRYNVILVCLSLQQNVTIFPLQSKLLLMLVNIDRTYLLVTFCTGNFYKLQFAQPCY